MVLLVHKHIGLVFVKLPPRYNEAEVERHQHKQAARAAEHYNDAEVAKEFFFQVVVENYFGKAEIFGVEIIEVFQQLLLFAQEKKEQNNIERKEQKPNPGRTKKRKGAQADGPPEIGEHNEDKGKRDVVINKKNLLCNRIESRHGNERGNAQPKQFFNCNQYVFAGKQMLHSVVLIGVFSVKAVNPHGALKHFVEKKRVF